MAETTVMISQPQYAAQELAKEQAEMRAKGIKLDRTEPGGSYMGTDGKLHDAHGVALEDRSEVDGLSADETNEALAEAEAKVRALRSRLPAANAEAAQQAEKDAAARQEKEAAKAAPKARSRR